MNTRSSNIILRTAPWLGWVLLLCLTFVLFIVLLPKQTPNTSLEGQLEHFIDDSNALTFETIKQTDFVRQHFVHLPEFRSLGYDTNTHWFHTKLNLDNHTPHRILTIGSPELENLDIWVEQPDGHFNMHTLGYHSNLNHTLSRLFLLPVDTFPGMQLFFRVRTTNAINIYTEILPIEAFIKNETRANFFQGIYFGILLIAMMLYTILGVRLHDTIMTAYAGYIAAQILFHLGATGYLSVLLVEQTAWLIDALPRIGWLSAAIFIVLMWDRLLQLKQTYPIIHRLYLFTIALNLCLLFFALQPSLVTENLLYIVKFANYLNVLNFIIAMYLLLQSWYQSQRHEWVIYLVAFIIPAFGSLVNTLTNQGFLPWNVITNNVYQIAALVHILVMSYGLSLRLHQLQQDKMTAEQTAKTVTQQAEQQRHFVAMLSHEFGNPLAAIDRATQMLLLNLPTLSAKDKQRLIFIRDHAATLSGFVERFLMTEALDKGGLSLTRARYSLHHLIEHAIHQQPTAIHWRIQQRYDAQAMFEFDSTLMIAAVTNLLTNALRYSPADSSVIITAAVLNDELHIKVTDHGTNLSADELDKLGTPYFRGAAAMAKKGNGLGYYFTRRIVEAHGGTLTAQLNAGTGLTVHIILPHTTSASSSI